MKNIKNILFDCDGVLYQDLESVFGQVSKRMTKYISDKLKIDLIPKAFKCSPPTDKYSISDLVFLSLVMIFEANLSPDGSPVSTNIFFIPRFCLMFLPFGNLFCTSSIL